MTLRAPSWVADGSTGVVSPQDARLALSGLVSGVGILRGFEVTGNSAGPDMQYDIAAGVVSCARGTVSGDGVYFTPNDGPHTENSGAPAPSSGTRWDLIWVRAKNTELGDADSTPEFDVEVGVAGSDPVKPYASVPAGALVLAESLVPTNAPNAASAVISMVAEKVTGIAAAPDPVVGHISSSGGTATTSDTTIPIGAAWDTTVQLTGGFTRSSGLVVPAAGTYLLTGAILWAGNSAGRRGTWFTRNSSQLGEQAFAARVEPTNRSTAQANTMPFELSAGDVISLIPYQDTGANLNWLSAELSATLIR